MLVMRWDNNSLGILCHIKGLKSFKRYSSNYILNRSHRDRHYVGMNGGIIDSKCSDSISLRACGSSKGCLCVFKFRRSHRDRHYVGIMCFDRLANQKTRQHQNQSLEFQDPVLQFSERDLSNCLQIYVLFSFKY